MEKIDVGQLELNPFTEIGEEWFLLSAGGEKGWNTMTAGWGGMGFIWGRPALFVFVRESRHTLSFMDECDRFSVSFLPPEKKDALIFCGSHSGRDTDKAAGAGLTPVFTDGTVLFSEANMSFVCRKVSKHHISSSGMLDSAIPEKWYRDGDWHWMFVGLVESAYVPEMDVTVVDSIL